MSAFADPFIVSNFLPIVKDFFKKFREKTAKKQASENGCLKSMEQGTGIEPASVAWEATILPMN